MKQIGCKASTLIPSSCLDSLTGDNIQSTAAVIVHPVFNDPDNMHTQGHEPDPSGIWEPSDPLHGVEDQMDPGLGDEMLEDDEARKELPKKHHALRKVKNCEFCNVKHFPSEGPAFCCRNRKVHIYIPEVPHELRWLLASQIDRHAKYFRKHIQYFNSHFSFTSFGVSSDQRLANAKGSSVYCFKAHGQLYHKLDPLTPSGTVKNVQDYTIELKTSIGVDQRRYNAPAMDQIPLCRPSCSDHESDVDENMYGDVEGLEIGGSLRWVSAREYKCYKLRIREGQFNVFFHAGRLFQQLLVDWYIKVESMRLDWYSKPTHQALICVDLYQADASKAGLRIVLSKQFSGSDHDVLSQFMDAMTLVTCYGKPDYFVTMTCNPYWDEIMAELLPGQTPQDCPDVVQGKDMYPIYRRREDGQKVKVRGEELDNRWVVPYNPVLLMWYNCHINVEICSSIKSVKYLYKYIYKGHDRTSFFADAKGNEYRVVNEIMQYRDVRMIIAIEEVCKLFGFKLYSRPPVLQMQVHLPGLHMVAYRATDNLQDVVDHARLVYINPNEGDRYYLRVLLTHVRGATSYDSLKTWCGITYDTFRAAAEAMGFVDTNKSLDDCVTKCAMVRFPSSLHRLFATIMVFCECANIRHLWDKHYESLAEDFHRTNDNNTIVGQLVLRDISFHLKSMGKDIRHYGLRELHESSFFVDGPSGTSKTYLYKALLAKVHSMHLITVATATSGIAASIMPGAAYSRFKIPVKLDDSTMCSFIKQSDMFFPAVARGTRAQITDATLLKSYIWESVRRIRLTQNMRAQSDMWFADYLLRMGNGTKETFGDEYVLLPDDIFIDSFRRYFILQREHDILSTRNEHVDAINALMIDRFPGTNHVYYSFDSVEDDTRNNYPLDFLNSITPSRLPPHELTIKKNYPVILLRNLDPHNGLCNGTRLIVRGF
ncbi:hypothetical protein SETIT_3G282400v2 [Setaria italica]|uniref:ATP-dependent DNA helicase n=1 Tax=Setaria italica TaxID=4555 RepID=A0A368QLS6_SETIT|nr:hypothetical protein SETIT_3G282400v2 [Setaria italica]